MRLSSFLHSIREDKAPQTGLRFVHTEDSEGDRNRGWTVDRIDAFIGDHPVGYLKLSYIPRDRFEREYPDVLNFLGKIEGSSYILPDESMPFERWPDDNLRKVATYLNRGETPPTDRDQLLVIAARVNSDRNNRNKFVQFENFFVDKPLVDYISVEPEFRRRGIATALYMAGARWMAQKGMKVYASGLQSDEAKAAWDDLTAKGLVGVENPTGRGPIFFGGKPRKYLRLPQTESLAQVQGNFGPVRILINPTPEQIVVALNRSEYKELRGLIWSHTHVVFWDGRFGTHDDMVDFLTEQPVKELGVQDRSFGRNSNARLLVFEEPEVDKIYITTYVMTRPLARLIVDPRFASDAPMERQARIIVLGDRLDRMNESIIDQSEYRVEYHRDTQGVPHEVLVNPRWSVFVKQLSRAQHRCIRLLKVTWPDKRVDVYSWDATGFTHDYLAAQIGRNGAHAVAYWQPDGGRLVYSPGIENEPRGYDDPFKLWWGVDVKKLYPERPMVEAEITGYHGTYRAYSMLKPGTADHPSGIGVWFSESREVAEKFAQQSSRRFADSEPTLFETRIDPDRMKSYATYNDYLEDWRKAGSTQKLRRELIGAGFEGIEIIHSQTDFPIERRDFALFKSLKTSQIEETDWDRNSNHMSESQDTLRLIDVKEPLSVLVDPSPRELIGQINRTKYHSMRAIICEDGHLIAWDAASYPLHHMVAEAVHQQWGWIPVAETMVETHHRPNPGEDQRAWEKFGPVWVRLMLKPENDDWVRKWAQQFSPLGSITEDTSEGTQNNWRKGSTAWFEYHCNRDHSSEDAPIWYRSHQRVQVLEIAEPGNGQTLDQRIEQGEPRTYRVKFADGLLWDVFEDELFVSDRFFTPGMGPPDDIPTK